MKIRVALNTFDQNGVLTYKWLYDMAVSKSEFKAIKKFIEKVNNNFELDAPTMRVDKYEDLSEEEEK